VSIEAVARRAGITRGTVYQHFADLDALLAAVVERETSSALAQICGTGLTDPTRGDPLELMLDSLRAYLNAVRSHPATWRLVLMPQEGAPDILHKRIAEGRAAVLRQLVDAVRPAWSLDHEADPELTTRVLSAISDEYARLVLTDPGRYPLERLLPHARWWLKHATLRS
jgi:AcrR family transcriptional regulator